MPCSPPALSRRIGGLSAILADDFLVALEPEFGWRDADENVVAALIPFCHAIGTKPSSEAIWQRLCAVAGGIASGKVRGDAGQTAGSGARRHGGRVRRKSSVIS